MSVLNGGDTGPLVGRFTPDMLKEFTEARIKESLLAIRDSDLGGPPIHLVEIEARSTEFAITGFVFGPKRKMSVFLAVDDETGLISGLRFSRAGYLRSRAGDWDAYTGDLGRRKGLLSFGAYEVIIVPGTPGTPATPANRRHTREARDRGHARHLPPRRDPHHRRPQGPLDRLRLAPLHPRRTRGRGREEGTRVGSTNSRSTTRRRASRRASCRTMTRARSIRSRASPTA
jgi:hypothetical protein